MSDATPPENQPGYVPRRDRLKARFRHAAFTHMPIKLTGGRLGRARSVHRFRRIERVIALPELSDPLDGLRITHLSDLHIGSLITTDSLPRIIRATNRLRGDMICVTGDFVDLSLKCLDKVIDALKQLSAPLGVFLVPGNHDYLEDGPQLIRRIRHAGLRLMINEFEQISHHGCRINIAGIDYASKPKPLSDLVTKALHHAPHRTARNRGDLRLLLSHHPDAFNCAHDHGIHLTLAGHTHGGQVVLGNGSGAPGDDTGENARKPFGLGSLAFRYPHGLYRRGDSYLYVTSGVGSWFPLRIGCPAEIASIVVRSQVPPTSEMSHP